MAGNAYHAVCSCFALSSKLGSRLYCSVLRRDSTVLVSLTPCCTLSPACVTAEPAFGRLQCCAQPLGFRVDCVQLCNAAGVLWVCYHCCAVRAALWELLLCVFSVNICSLEQNIHKKSLLSACPWGGESRSQLASLWYRVG
jgi:hypothetical protein